MNADRMSVVAEGLFAAAAGEQKWDDALHLLDRHLNVEGTLIIDTHPTGFIAARSKSLDDSTHAYLRHGWYHLDQRYLAVPMMRRGAIATDLDLFSHEQMARMPYYQEFVRAQGLCWWACLIAKTRKSEIAVSLQRTARQGLFDSGDLRRMAALRHQITDALAIQELRTAAYLSGMTEVLETLDTAAFIVSSKGKIARMNRLAEAIIGSELVIINDRLHAVDPAVQTRSHTHKR